VKFLIDQNLSRRVVEGLTKAGHDAVHVADLGMSRAADADIVRAAVKDDRIIISADTDFGTILAVTGDARPSVLLIRRSSGRRAADLTALLLANLESVADALATGAVVVLDSERVRVRPLPLR
jgi:predicted nuclease of predicted toxin-antitoxin system